MHPRRRGMLVWHSHALSQLLLRGRCRESSTRHSRATRATRLMKRRCTGSFQTSFVAATVPWCMVQHISGLSCISCNSCEMEGRRTTLGRRTTWRAVGLHWAPDGSTEAPALDAHDVPTHRFFPLLEAKWSDCLRHRGMQSIDSGARLQRTDRQWNTDIVVIALKGGIP